MRTNNIQGYNPQFTSIYRIKHTTKTDKVIFDNGIGPLTASMCKVPIMFSQGKNPFEPAIISYAQNIAKRMNSGYEWISQNVSKYGKSIPNPEDMVAWILTGKNDVERACKFVLDYPTPGSFKYIIKNLLFSKYNTNYDAIPKHLQNLFRHIDENENANIQFEKHMLKQGKIIDCNNFEDFLEKFCSSN